MPAARYLWQAQTRARKPAPVGRFLRVEGCLGRSSGQWSVFSGQLKTGDSLFWLFTEHRPLFTVH